MQLLFRLAVFFSLLFSLSSASAQILAEAFRSIGCVNCSDPDKLFEEFVTAHPEYKINMLYIHNNIASNDDPFYASAKADVDARQGASFYNVSSDPDVFISGFNGGTGQQSESNWEKLAAAPASAAYPGTMTALVSFLPDHRLKIDLQAQSTTGNAQVRPFIMLVESGIIFNNTEGYVNPTGNIWNNIFRAMIPGSTGGPSSAFTGTLNYSFNYDPTGKPWNLKNCKIYAFLQEVAGQPDGSHAIDAFATADIPQEAVSSNTTLSTQLFAPSPNPAQSFSRIQYHLSNPANVKIVISDDLGREITTVVNSFISETESSAIFMPTSAANGVYYARMYADGAFVGMQKIVFAP